jgi:hypothetical protein
MRHLNVDDKRKLGALLKQRKDRYAEEYSIERMRRELMQELQADISRQQMAMAWYVLEGAGVMPKLQYRLLQREIGREAERESLVARLSKLESAVKALKDMGLEVPDVDTD